MLSAISCGLCKLAALDFDFGAAGTFVGDDWIVFVCVIVDVEVLEVEAGEFEKGVVFCALRFLGAIISM